MRKKQISGQTTDLEHNKIAMRCTRSCYKLWTVKCSSCGAATVNIETFNSLSLSLNDTLTIHQAVDNFFNAQSVKNYKCKRCKHTGNGDMVTSLVSIPKNVLIHLKRFSNSGRKDMRKLTISEEIRLRPYVCANKKELLEDKADLYGAILHWGMKRNQGHFIAILRNRMHWFKVDDMKITRMSKESALKEMEDSYILFYRTRPRPYIN